METLLLAVEDDKEPLDEPLTLLDEPLDELLDMLDDCDELLDELLPRGGQGKFNTSALASLQPTKFSNSRKRIMSS